MRFSRDPSAFPGEPAVITACVWLAATGLLTSAHPAGSYETVWSTRVASRLTAPPICMPSCVWIAHRGGIQARSLIDGSLRYRVKTKSEMRLVAMGADTIVAWRGRPRGEVLMLGSARPRVLSRERLPHAILAADCTGDEAALLFRHGLRRFVRGRWVHEAFPAAAAPGWTHIHAVATRCDTMRVLSRRSGGTLLVSQDSVAPAPRQFRGGVVEAAAVGDGVLLVSDDGVLALLDCARNVVWERELPAPLQSPPVLDGRWVWAALRDRTLARVDSRDGTHAGSWRLPGPLSCPLARYDRGVAWGTFDGNVWAVTALDEAPKSLAHLASPAVGVAEDGERIIVALENGRLVCLAPPPGARSR